MGDRFKSYTLFNMVLDENTTGSDNFVTKSGLSFALTRNSLHKCNEMQRNFETNSDTMNNEEFEIVCSGNSGW